MPPGPLTTNCTVSVSATRYVCTMLVAVVLLVSPSPKSQNRLVMRPSEVSVNVTARGVAPLVGVPSRPVKFARFEAVRSDMVEIVIGDVVVRAGGDVEPNRLVDVIRAVRKA